MENNYDLIYGKDKTERIVGLEITDDKAEVFIQQENGEVISEIRDNRFWILSNRQITPKFKRLEGDLFYKWMASTSDRELFEQSRRKWKNLDIYSIYSPKEAYMVRNGLTFFKGMKHTEISVLSFDLETTGLFHNENSKILLISNTFRNHNGEITKKLFAYDEYETQGGMIVAWCDWVRKINPIVLLAHNGLTFDIQYLKFMASQENIELKLGRDGSPVKFNKYSSSYRIDGSRDLEYYGASIYGREFIDSLFLSYKYGVIKNYNSNGLKYLIKEEGLEKPNRTFYDASLIRINYKNPIEWEKIKKYCEDDSDDSLSIFDLMAPAQFYWTQMVGKTFQATVESATGSQINNILMRSYLQDRHSLPKANHIDTFQGALSYAEPGIHINQIRFDVIALYPSVIVQYKLYDKEKDPKGNYLKLTETLRQERIKNKTLAKTTGLKYYKDLEQSQKIAINSIFGAAGAPGLLFNSISVANDITKYGREILTLAVKWASGIDVKEWMNKENENLSEMQ